MAAQRKRTVAQQLVKPATRCRACGASSTKGRDISSRRYQLEAFLDWLLSRTTQSQARGYSSARTFRRTTGWCWNIHPVIEPTGEIYDEVQLVGFFVDDYCCLIACSGSTVIDYQWASEESAAGWGALLARIPAPAVVVTDGGTGIYKEATNHWPTTKIQRCRVHIQRSVRRYLTRNPRTDAGKQLAGIARALTQVKTLDEAAEWAGQLAQWHSLHRDFLNEKTYTNDPLAARPWQYTHLRVRQAFNAINSQLKRGTLFTYLAEEFTDNNIVISSTTNRIQGGINAPLRALLQDHRGMNLPRRRRAMEWWLYQHSEAPAPAHTLIHPEHYQPKKKRISTIDDTRIGPAGYDTGFSWEDGNGIQHGWGGKHH